MSTKLPCAVLAPAAVLALAGCTANTGLAPLPDNFGEASRQTFAAQIIDPAPEYDTLVPETSGDHVQDAADRYNAGTVRKPPRQSTTTGTSGSGSGLSGSGGA